MAAVDGPGGRAGGRRSRASLGALRRKRAKLWTKATFIIEMVGPGEFAMHAALKKEGELWGAQVTLDEFLKQRFHGMQRMELEGVTVNIQELLDLINEKFVMGK